MDKLFVIFNPAARGEKSQRVRRLLAAKALGIDSRTILAMAARGEIITRRAGRRVLVDAASLRPPSREQIAELARAAREPRS